jgi:hypothetical protein
MTIILLLYPQGAKSTRQKIQFYVALVQTCKMRQKAPLYAQFLNSENISPKLKVL